MSTKHAAFLQYAADAKSQNATVRCRREVILSAGALSSPVLMQVSGIGPSDVLRDLGVDVAVELPGVGRNLQDHPMAQVVYECKSPRKYSFKRKRR